jgi:hypothetical protein
MYELKQYISLWLVFNIRILLFINILVLDNKLLQLKMIFDQS